VQIPRSVRILGISLLVLWLTHQPIIDVLVDWQWFDTIGYVGVFETMLTARLGAGIAGFIVAALVIGLNVRWAFRAAPINPMRLAMLTGDVGLDADRLLRFIRVAGVLGVGFLAFMFGLGAMSLWLDVLTFIAAEPFGMTDVVFGRDVGFYIFELPLIASLHNMASALLVVTILPVAIYHVFQQVYINRSQEILSPPARKQVLLLMGLLFLVSALGWWLDRFGLLYQKQGAVWGIGYADLHARLPAFWAMMVVSIAVALALISSLKQTNLRRPVTALGGYFLVRLLLVSAWPGVVQEYSVRPNELGMESEFLVSNIEATRTAYALDRVEVRPFEAAEDLTLADVQAHPETVENIRVWDDKPLLTTYQQLQEIRLYYDFVDVDVDRYEIDGRSRQVMLAARELNYANVPQTAQSWFNEHFQYTHGYGLTMSPVNIVTEEGLPDLFIQDIPPESSIGIEIDRPEVYYGEVTNQYVLVDTKAKEFDYPMGDQNAYTKYAGEGGVAIGTLAQQTLFALYFQELDILLTNYLTPQSKVMFRRRIQDRVQTLAPFLTFERDPYLVVTDGRMRWMIDAYTTTDRFPYSEPSSFGGQRINYLRNSVKVVVDAYDGTVDFYVSDAEDPIIRVFGKIFPEMFKSMAELPESLASHVRYPVGFFDVQAALFRAYHMTDPTVFYNKEDMWEAPREIFGSQEQTMRSYYLIMKLPGEDTEEFILLVPFVPTGKENMISWLAARCDPEHYGKLLLYQFPKKKVIFGPGQIEARIDQTPEISEQLTLWSQAGSRVVRGNLLVIPIEDSLMYVEAVYLQAESAQMPELKRVIVVYEKRIAMESTLEEALAKVFSAKTPRRKNWSEQGRAEPRVQMVVPVGTSWETLATSAQATYVQAIEAQKAGDWAGYGAALEELEATLGALTSATEGE
jgi:uncharacterized membrane protein (UPF0182 family)